MNQPGSPQELEPESESEAAGRLDDVSENSVRPAPVHPLLFAVFPVLALYARNIGEAPLSAIWRPLGLSLLGAVVLWGVAALLLRSARKAALAASVVLVAFFSYGHVWNLLPAGLRGALAPAAIGITALAIAAVARSRGQFARLTAGLNIASVVLVIPSCWTIAAGLLPAVTRPSSAVSQPAAVAPVPSPPNASAAASNLPDVYYIILDAYGRGDSLKTFYGFDNTPFLKELERRGFYIAARSRANYDQTSLCIASALNMRYLDGMGESIAPEIGADESLRRIIDRNQVAARLRKKGYRYVSVSSGVGQTRADSADVRLGDGALAPKTSALEQQMVSMTVFETPAEQRKKSYDRHRRYIVSAFDALDSVARQSGPKFVFAHILAPHPPFVLGPNGEAVEPPYMFNLADASWLLQIISQADYERGYIGQLQHVNRRVLQAVDSIQRGSTIPPIIIVQGDHGSRMRLDWDSLDKSDLREPFSILNAYCVPDSVRKSLYEDITPVNSFRVLFSSLFKSDLPRLSDRSAYSTASRPLEFTDITKRLDSLSMAALPAAPPKPARPGGDIQAGALR